MTENNPTPTPEAPAAEVVVKKPSLYKRVTTAHPRITNAAKVTLAIVGTAVVTRGVTNAQHNKERLTDAKQHAAEAVDALSDSVAIPDTEA